MAWKIASFCCSKTTNKLKPNPILKCIIAICIERNLEFNPMDNYNKWLNFRIIISKIENELQRVDKLNMYRVQNHIESSYYTALD